MAKPKRTLIFTGGHHSGSLPVVKKLISKGWEIIWIGHRHSMWGDSADTAEYSQVTALGIPFYNLTAGKLYRTFHPIKLLRLPYGFVQAFFIILKLKLKIGSNLKGIVSFGGYLAAPVVITGWLIGLKSITHEQTVVAGWANRLVAYFANYVALTWPQSALHYPKSKTVITGLPLRQEVIMAKKLSGSSHAPTRPIIYIQGGKQGSHTLNKLIFSVLADLVASHYMVIHQTGKNTQYKDYEKALQIKKQLPKKEGDNYQVYDYTNDRDAAHFLSTAAVVISRGGAHTCYELLYLGTKSVIIPIPWVSHNEQFKNAYLLVENNQAIILEQHDLRPTDLLGAIEKVQTFTPGKINIPDNALELLVQLIEQVYS